DIRRFFQELGYFGQPSLPAKLSSAEKLIGRLLYQFQCGIKFNQHGVYQAENVEAGKNPSLFDVGTSVYPTLLLFNHSCCPNTFRINDGKKILVIAKHEINPGDEVTDCYGIHHLSMPRDERQLKLSRSFKFTCTCKACSEDWPLFPTLDSNLTQSEMGRLGNHLSLYQKKFKAGNYQEAYTHCRDYLIKLKEIGIVYPHRNFEIAGLALTSCFWKPLEEK
ncbi:SET and MYND domain-containing protein 4, partial [Eurytemora carolleeae]|uniref:SET and MYND domain-containing protein 4 n=1 Tax=Eurytemora carolleeae TaxID=1294199 RepID=UPI000C769055